MKGFLRPIASRLGTSGVGAGLFSTGMAVIAIIVYWGFTVDDALITARMAHHVATGIGYRFNPGGPIVDAVTPLGWAHVLAPFSEASPMRAFLAARWIGVGAVISSMGWLGVVLARRGIAVWPLAAISALAPIGIWASSGMETPVVMALVTIATEQGMLSRCCLGLAAAWRPELLPFAIVLALGRARNLPSAGRDLAMAVTPAITVGLLRWWLFGRAYPLAVVAKPSDGTQGLWYALEALVWSGPIWLWLGSGWSLRLGALGRRETPILDTLASGLGSRDADHSNQLRAELVLAFAVLAHFVSTGLAGGDWMPGYRLVVPVLPAALRVACYVATGRFRFLNAVGVALFLVVALRVGLKLGPNARRIVDQRSQLIETARSALSGASVVAAPDVGWVGVAFAGEILDLAGATDESVAFLHGGHTSKEVELRLLVSRHVDYVVALTTGLSTEENWTTSRFVRAIDARVARLSAEQDCHPHARIPLAFTSQAYLILRCTRP